MGDVMERYMEACHLEDPIEKLAALMECADQEEDEMVCRQARYKLAVMFWNGEGTEQDKETAKELALSSAEMGMIQAMEFYARILREEGDIETAEEYEEKAAKNRLSDEELAKMESNIMKALQRMALEDEKEQENLNHEQEEKRTEQKNGPKPFGAIDVVLCAVIAAVLIFVFKFIFHIPFFLPWVIVTAALSLWVYKS